MSARLGREFILLSPCIDNNLFIALYDIICFESIGTRGITTHNQMSCSEAKCNFIIVHTRSLRARVIHTLALSLRF
jgi:hypothetical protein